MSAGLKQGGIVIGTRARDEEHAEQIKRDLGTYRRHRRPAVTNGQNERGLRDCSRSPRLLVSRAPFVCL